MGYIVEVVIAMIAFAGTIIGSYSGFRLTAYRVEQLEHKVAEHNDFARRIPLVEEKIKVVNHRLDDLENEGGS